MFLIITASNNQNCLLNVDRVYMTVPLTGNEQGFYKAYVGEGGWMKISEAEHNRLISKLEEMKETI